MFSTHINRSGPKRKVLSEQAVLIFLILINKPVLFIVSIGFEFNIISVLHICFYFVIRIIPGKNSVFYIYPYFIGLYLAATRSSNVSSYVNIINPLSNEI